MINRITCPTCAGDGELWLDEYCGDPEHCSPKGTCSTCNGDGELLVKKWENMAAHGKIEYRSLDGSRNCEPGTLSWNAADMAVNGDVLDLMVMRIQMIRALKKIEDFLQDQGLLDRVT